MITEDYVSFETAKLLKEKGFDCACKVWYAEYTSVWGGDPSGDRKYINIQFDDKNMFDDSYKFLCYAPTLQMAMKWLREMHKLCISITPQVTDDDGDGGCLWQFAITSHLEPLSISLELYEQYEEACEAAIKYCLENLI